MSIDINDDIVQDFLVEVGEIIEQLGEELIELESEPGNMDILNAVFRAFHTIKGGAGFLGLEALVDICHKSENIFDLLRHGEKEVSQDLMDKILLALDAIQQMYAEIQQGISPRGASPELLSSLAEHTNKDNVQAGAEQASRPVEARAVEDSAAAAGDMEETEESTTAADEITDEEFEMLLDELHGKGNAVSAVAVDSGGNDPEQLNRPLAAADGMATVSPIRMENDAGEISTITGPAVKSGAASGVDNKQAQNTSDGKNSIQDNKSAVTPPDKRNTTDSTVRVETDTLDRIMNMVGELVLIRNRLVNLDTLIGNDEMSSTVNSLDVVTADLQASVMKTRMQAVKKIFGRFPRVVRDVARNLNKEVILKTEGEDTDLDKNLVEALVDPLIHLIRNAVDHGIELPDVREAAGKARQGSILLSAEQEGDHILLKISDDGAGMDAGALRRKAVSKGIMDESSASRLSDQECFNLIFLPGFSTREQVSDISGRGVGMDVVRTRLNQFSGTVYIESELGKGTTIHIRVPLTLAIMPTLMVELGKQEQVFALPLANVNEILDFDQDSLKVLDGQQVLLLRGKPLPLYQLGNWLTPRSAQAEIEGHVVVVNIGTMIIGLLVDRLIGREEVVIKPLGALLHGTRGMSGATVTGNGKIALILDLPGLVQSYAGYH